MPARDTDYLKEPLGDYLARLAARTPVPGGGSAVALVASVSSALIGMVLNYTLGKEKYAGYEEELKRILKENDVIFERLSRYVEEDSRIYNNIRKHTRENQSLAEKYLKESAGIHIDICSIAVKLVSFSDFLSQKGNKNLLSDAGISAELALSSFKTAKLNVLINLRYIQDKDFCKDASSRLSSMEKDIAAKEKRVYLNVVNDLRG